MYSAGNDVVLAVVRTDLTAGDLPVTEWKARSARAKIALAHSNKFGTVTAREKIAKVDMAPLGLVDRSGIEVGSYSCMRDSELGHVPPSPESVSSLQAMINVAFDRLQCQIEAERQHLLAQANLSGNATSVPNPTQGTDVPPLVSIVMNEIRTRLQYRRNSVVNPGIKAVDPSPKALRLLADLGNELGMLQEKRKAGYPRDRKGLAILAVMAEKADTAESVSLQDIQEATGYRASTLGPGLTTWLNRLLDASSWRVIGSESAGWKLVRARY